MSTRGGRSLPSDLRKSGSHCPLMGLVLNVKDSISFANEEVALPLPKRQHGTSQKGSDQCELYAQISFTSCGPHNSAETSPGAKGALSQQDACLCSTEGHRRNFTPTKKHRDMHCRHMLLLGIGFLRPLESRRKADINSRLSVACFGTAFCERCLQAHR